jgi:hypothetical protein
MFEKFVPQLKKEVRKALGDKLAISKVKTIIEASDNPGRELSDFAFLLSQPEIRKLKTWKKLSDAFFAVYAEELIRDLETFYGDTPKNRKPPVEIPDPDLVIAHFACMKREGACENYSFDRLGKMISANFSIGYAPATICNKLKMNDPK